MKKLLFIALTVFSMMFAVSTSSCSTKTVNTTDSIEVAMDSCCDTLAVDTLVSVADSVEVDSVVVE